MIVDTALDASMRISSLGPTCGSEISALVTRVVPLVFATAQHKKAAGALAANEVRRANLAKRKAQGPSAAEITDGTSSRRLVGDITVESAAAEYAAFQRRSTRPKPICHRPKSRLLASKS